MNKKAVSMALVDIFSAVIIMLAIVGFYFAFKISVEASKVSIRDNMRANELDNVMLAYLGLPVEYKSASMTNAERIIAMINDGSIKGSKEPYLLDYQERTGYCINYISIYTEPSKVAVTWLNDCNDQSGPEQISWITMPGPDEQTYYIEAKGYGVSS